MIDMMGTGAVGQSYCDTSAVPGMVLKLKHGWEGVVATIIHQGEIIRVDLG